MAAARLSLEPTTTTLPGVPSIVAWNSAGSIAAVAVEGHESVSHQYRRQECRVNMEEVHDDLERKSRCHFNCGLGRGLACWAGRTRNGLWRSGDIVIGIIGAFIGSWLLPQLGVRIGSGIVSAIVSATIGAVLLLLVLRTTRRRRRW